VQRQEISGMTVPWRHGLAVERNDSIVWAGCITSRRYDSRTGTYRFGTTGILGYWRRRVVAANISWKAVDQFSMVRQLLQLGGTTIPLTFTYADSGVQRDRTFAAADLKLVLDAILEIADNLDGFDIAVTSEWDTAGGSTTPRIKHRLLLGYPRLGNTGSLTELMAIEWPHNTVGAYPWDEDGSEFATHVWASSQTDEGVTLIRSAANQSLLDLGYPRLDLPKTFSNISVVATLDAHAAQALAEASGFGSAPAFTVKDEGETAAGGWLPGDDVHVRITDPMRFPRVDGSPAPGLEARLRIQEASLDPPAGTIAMTLAPIIVPVT
jgi:hypothetical protein